MVTMICIVSFAERETKSKSRSEGNRIPATQTNKTWFDWLWNVEVDWPRSFWGGLLRIKI